MHYMGGKARIARHIGDFLKTLRKPGQIYIEPFCGAGSVMFQMAAEQENNFAYDAHKDLILMWLALQRGWKPPRKVSEEEHRRLRHGRHSALRGFVGFSCSFGGKFFSGYARAKKSPRGFANESANVLEKKMVRLQAVKFAQGDFGEIEVDGALIYCDPPYAGTSGFRGVPKFDHDRFWETVRAWSKKNTVVISEATAPDDFKPVMEIHARQSLTLRGTRVEFLWMHRG